MALFNGVSEGFIEIPLRPTLISTAEKLRCIIACETGYSVFEGVPNPLAQPFDLNYIFFFKHFELRVSREQKALVDFGQGRSK